MFKIAHITDLHLTDDFEPARGVDVAGNFIKTLDSIGQDQTIDQIVLTGDLCFQDPNEIVMKWVREMLEQTGIPFHVIPGNHDSSKMMAKVFAKQLEINNSELYYIDNREEINFLLLDTAKGYVSKKQLDWLKQNANDLEGPSIVFMHHPPVNAVPYMDANYSMTNKKEFQQVLYSLENIEAIFCGHYHIGKKINMKDLPPVYITPSTYFQIDDTTEDFKISSYNIGWRKIVWKDNNLKTGVVWVS